jgi:hypothetical protein
LTFAQHKNKGIRRSKDAITGFVALVTSIKNNPNKKDKKTMSFDL